MEESKKKLATSVLNTMYILLDRDIDLNSLKEVKIYAEHILCSTDNVMTLLKWLNIKDLKPQITKHLCEDIYLYVEFKKDNISQKAAISDIRAFHKSEGEDDMEISVESAMRHYLGIDCFSSV